MWSFKVMKADLTARHSKWQLRYTSDTISFVFMLADVHKKYSTKTNPKKTILEILIISGCILHTKFPEWLFSD